MNGISNFIKTLFPSTEKRRLLALMDAVYGDLEKNVLPTLQVEDSVFSALPLYNNVSDRLAGPNGPSDYKGQAVSYLRNTVEFVLDERNNMLAMFENAFATSIEVEGLDYKKAHLMHLVTGFVFATEFLSKLTYILSAQAANVTYGRKGIESEYEEFLNDSENLMSFAIFTTVLRTKPKDLSKELDKIKNMSFDADTHATMQRIHKGKIDPFRMNMVPVIFEIAQFIGEAQNDSLRTQRELTEARLKATQYNILLLEADARSAEPDEKEAIEKQIKYWRGYIVKLEEKLEDLNDV